MGRNLLGSNGFHEVSQVVVVGVHEGVGFGVVRVDVSGSHGVDFVLVVTLAVKCFVSGLGTINKEIMLLKLNAVSTITQIVTNFAINLSLNTYVLADPRADAAACLLA